MNLIVNNPPGAPMPVRYLPGPQVAQMVGASVPTLYRLMNAGKFPRSVRISPRRVAWRESAVLDWLRQREAEAQAQAATAQPTSLAQGQ